MDGEIDDVVEGFVLLVGGFLLFGVLGSVWHQNLTTEFLLAFASDSYSGLHCVLDSNTRVHKVGRTTYWAFVLV